MAQYYFLNTLFAPLEFGHPPTLDFKSLIANVQSELSKDDLMRLSLLRSYFDIENLKAFFMQEALSPYGNHEPAKLVADNLENETGYPEFVFEFLREFETSEKRLHHFAKLLTQFFSYAQQQSSGFIQEFFAFEKQWRLVMLGFRSKLLKTSLKTQLQFEDPYDPIVIQIIAQKDAKHFEPPEEFEDLKDLFSRWKHSPRGIFKALEEYRMSKIDQMVEKEIFSFDAVAAYIVKLIIIEKWLDLEKCEKKGFKNLDKILEEVS